jgi:hypothetical protein
MQCDSSEPERKSDSSCVRICVVGDWLRLSILQEKHSLATEIADPILDLETALGFVWEMIR